MSKYLKKTVLLYAGATLLYLPISIYAGHWPQDNLAAAIIRNIIFDGTFYHLWYLPASIIGVLIVYALGRGFSFRMVCLFAAFLYLAGLLGDSYYGIVLETPFLENIYGGGFRLFSYTRNGLFYAPVFLVMGAFMAKKSPALTKRTSLTGFCIFMVLMLAEGFILRYFIPPNRVFSVQYVDGNFVSSSFQRHDSMYLALIPCMYFLFQFLLASEGKTSPFLRDLSLWVYIIHPLCIIGVRGVARTMGLTGLLVENSVIHYLAVCLLSLVFAASIVSIYSRVIIHSRMKRHDDVAHAAKRKNIPSKEGRAWIELDMDNLRHNVDTLRSILPKTCELMPAVKANAYGHGAAIICRELHNLGIRAFCVASVAEGVELRKRRIKGEILVLGYTHPGQFHLLKRHRLTQTVMDYEYARTLDNYGKRIIAPAIFSCRGNKVHIKIDTGLKRLGESSENTGKIIRIFKCRNLAITGIYTHFSAQDDDFTQMQVDKFSNVLAKIKEHGFNIPKTHAQNSYGIFNCPNPPYDYARPGLAIYGAYKDTNNNMGLRPVLSVKTKISAVKTVIAGETVGYGSGFTAYCGMKIAVLSIGYADGIPRRLSCGIGGVLINGGIAPIIGHVCMDMMTVDITDAGDVKQGDTAVIIGKDGNQEITVFNLANQADTIPNEILSRLGGRLEKWMV